MNSIIPSIHINELQPYYMGKYFVVNESLTFGAHRHHQILSFLLEEHLPGLHWSHTSVAVHLWFFPPSLLSTVTEKLLFLVDIRRLTSPLKNIPFLCFHKAFSYFNGVLRVIIPLVCVEPSSVSDVITLPPPCWTHDGGLWIMRCFSMSQYDGVWVGLGKVVRTPNSTRPLAINSDVSVCSSGSATQQTAAYLLSLYSNNTCFIENHVGLCLCRATTVHLTSRLMALLHLYWYVIGLHIHSSSQTSAKASSTLGL